MYQNRRILFYVQGFDFLKPRLCYAQKYRYRNIVMAELHFHPYTYTLKKTFEYRLKVG